MAEAGKKQRNARVLSRGAAAPSQVRLNLPRPMDGKKPEQGRRAESDQPRDIEILRLSANLDGTDFAETARMARDSVLKWMMSDRGKPLPPEAFEHQEFEMSYPGHEKQALRFLSGSVDIWSARRVNPDRNSSSRKWITEVAVGGDTGDTAMIGVRLFVTTNEADVHIDPSVPGFVHDIIGRGGMSRSGRQLLNRPILIDTEEGIDRLCDYLEDPGRLLPAIVSCISPDPGRPLIEDEGLAKHLAGMARVYRITPRIAWHLSNRLERIRSVFDNGCRLYMPGFSREDDYSKHPLILGDALSTPKGVRDHVRFLRRKVASHSVSVMQLGRHIIDFGEIKTYVRSIRNTELANQAKASSQLQVTPSLDELQNVIGSQYAQIDGLNDEITSLREQIERQKKEVEHQREETAQWFDLAEDYATRASEAEDLNRKLSSTIEGLRGALHSTTGGTSVVSQELSLPDNWADFLGWFDSSWAHRVDITPAARREIRRGPSYEDVGKVARVVTWLATEYRDRRINGGGQLQEFTIEEGVRNTFCGGDAYMIDWRGRTCMVDSHIKSSNSRNPQRCLRIYYFWDAEAQRVVIDHMPSHRPNKLS